MVSRISHGAPRATSPAGSPAGPGSECRRRSTVSRRLAWLRPATGRVTRTSPWLSTTSEAGSILAYDGYGKDVFDLFFRQLTRRSGGASIWIVTGDGARRIDSCVHEWCPNAERVPDVFHIVSWIVFCQIFVGRFGVSFSPFERLFLGRFGFGQSCGLSVIA